MSQTPSPDTAADQAESQVETIAEDSVDVEPAAPAETRTFADFGVREDIAAALAEAGIVHPFPIQSMTLPIALSGQDIIGQAKTGTGKTLGFGIPAVQNVVGRDDDGWDRLERPGAPQALIVVPTRELAVQVGSDLSIAAKTRNARVLTIYGGRAYEPQIEALEKGVEVVVGTPGRLIDLNRQHHLDLSQVKTVVLDEADEMLDLGFLPDVEKLLAAVPRVRHTMLFSATMPGPVVAMARRYMSKPMHIRAAAPDEGSTKADIRQVVYRAHNLDKPEMLGRILQAEGRGRCIIFTRTKRTAAKVADELIERGFAAAPLHGDLGQGAREQALRAFRSSKVDILVATDVAARGIDVDDVTHVINYQCPEDEKTYLHRTGRTGRAGRKGTAITFVDWDDIPRWRLIDKALELGIPEPVETYSSSAHLFEDLGIPRGTKGKLPRSRQTHAGLGAEELEDLGGPDSRGDKGDSRSARGGSGGRGRSRGARSGGADSHDSGSKASGSSKSGSGRSRGRSRGGGSGESTDSNRSSRSGEGGRAGQGGNGSRNSKKGASSESGRSQGGGRGRRGGSGESSRSTRQDRPSERPRRSESVTASAGEDRATLNARRRRRRRSSGEQLTGSPARLVDGQG
ncbi:DEAD/DEAH box helicase [Kocuria sp. p3-SID1433]|uniref:DEAD/DEAH box helicase n=1 Tax=Kocuria sp. p3-SID1433 TaxID=2916181 RepID=UPI0021A56CC5|nr:DEAD/DEAH box helicase [Kocuria sp. p3-SID1433]MCT2181306.1 DEAD/DEAH box helicase [Kocuria sp. p3-SID1433]